jgi:hypothetical protein
MEKIDIGLSVKKDKEYRLGYTIGFLQSVAQRHKINEVKRLLTQQPNLIAVLKESGQSDEAIAKSFKLDIDSYRLLLAEIAETR